MADKEKSSGFIVETIKTVVYALALAAVFRSLFFQPFWIPSGSMKETLLIGDFLFVNKMAYGYSYASCPNVRLPAVGINIDAQSLCGFIDGDNTRIWGAEPERGDVAVFRHPVTGLDFIKRVVGMPGERIQMKQGVLHINDVPVELEDAGVFSEIVEQQGPGRVTPRCENGVVGRGGTCEKSRQIEVLPGGRNHIVLNIGNQSSDNTPVFTVPEGHFFFVGDNRDNSSDSRFSTRANGVGFVPYENLVGRADRVLFSSAGASLFAFWSWRSDRFFKRIE